MPEATNNQNQLPELKQTRFGRIKQVAIVDEMQKSYLDYAMSVIVSRALPDVKDGLKPVHRRILYAMHKMGLSHKASYKKSARIVGEVLGKYHPHGDQAVYDTLVRLAQDFSMRYPLVDGQGNFGSIDGDSPAAMRYTEARLAKITDELLVDLDKKTVKFIDNFDGSQKEPTVLPAKLPNLLLMGADGIAVGMATKIPPHNLNEVVFSIKEFIENSQVELQPLQERKKESTPGAETPLENIPAKKLAGKLTSQSTIEDLLKHIKGPDFPTGANIYNWKEIKQAYFTGKGKILTRATTEIVEGKKGKFKILVSEIPYQVNKARLIIKMAKLVKAKKITGITDIRDESDRRGLQIVIELKKGIRPKAVLNNLFKHTELQTSFPANMVALLDGTPQLLNLKQIITQYVKHRQLVVIKRSQYDLKQARLRAHILEGLKIALDNLDAVIETIKKSKDSETARKNLMKKFGLTKIQAEAILDMQLRRLSALERAKIEEEYKKIAEKIKRLVSLLSSPKKVLSTITKELDELVKVYGDKRRTKLHRQDVEEFSEKDLISKKPVIITVTKTGYVKRVPTGTYRSQRRGGKGVAGMTTKEADEVSHLITGTTHDDVLFFTNKGRVFKVKAYQIPEGSRQAKGLAVINLINIDQRENVQSVLSIKNIKEQKGYLFMATKNGMVKKSLISKFSNIKSNGLIAIRLKKNDQLIKANLTSGDDQIMLVTYKGKAIKFAEKDIRPMGRATSGVKGISLKKDDYVVTAESFPSKVQKPKDRRKKFFRDLLVVTKKGLGKRTAVKLFPLQKRAGVGVKVAKLNAKTGNIACAEFVTQNVKQIVLTTKKAQVIKLPLKNIKRIGRNTQGVILMRFGKNGGQVAALTCLRKIEEEKP